MQVSLASDLLRAQFTQLRVITGDQVRIDVLLVLTLPRLERVQLRQRRRSSDPLNCLVVGHEVDVLVLQQIVNELLEHSEVLLLFEPEGERFG